MRIKSALHFFPVQILLLQLQQNKILLSFWIILFGVVSGHLGGFFGLQCLMLDPEYVSQSDFKSFFVMGVALGAFTMSFHIASYISGVCRFSFLGALHRPFATFCLNNSGLPAVFFGFYIFAVLSFQGNMQRCSSYDKVLKSLGLLAGVASLTLALAAYLSITHRSHPKHRPKSHVGRFRRAILVRLRWRKWIGAGNTLRNAEVHSYLDAPWSIACVQVLHPSYDEDAAARVLKRYQINLLLFECAALGVLFALGYFGHHTISQIPAAATLILFLAVLIMLAGAIPFWAKGWTSTVVCGVVLATGLLMRWKVGLHRQDSRAFGMQYEGSRAPYNLARIRQLNADQNIREDTANTLRILQKWRSHFAANNPPKLVVICASGGGQKAALWTLRVLQSASQATQGRLIQHTVLMSCASGGALGAAYFRELCLRQKLGQAVDPCAKIHVDKISHSSLNPIVFHLIANDLLLDVGRFTYQGMRYRRDRGCAVENQVNEHTDGIMDKPLWHYRAPESEGVIPLMILSPTVLNDGRKLFISAQRVSYMGGDPCSNGESGKPRGVDFKRCFEAQGADNLRFLTALRMGATYPYILPAVCLPSQPKIQIADAGLLDNFGIADAIQFLHVFRHWIAANTSGVVLVVIRGVEDEQTLLPCAEPSATAYQRSILDLHRAWTNIQDVRNERLLGFFRKGFETTIDKVVFQYAPSHKHKKPSSPLQAASLSWYLDAEQKAEIVSAIHTDENLAAFCQLLELLSPSKRGCI